jgi:hypothetical protein
VIKRILFAATAWALLAFCTFGQSTLVSATVTDSSGQAWLSGSYKFTFYPSPSNPFGPYNWNGSQFNVNTVISGNLSVTGQIVSVSVPSNTSIGPSGSQWKLTVCPAASSSQCYTVNLTVTGSTQNVTAQVIPPPVQVNALSVNQLSAYSDTEMVNGYFGSTYFNMVDNTIHVCTGPTLPCTWVSLGGGGGTAAGPNGTVQISNGSGGFNAGNANDNATIVGAFDIMEKLNVAGDSYFKSGVPWYDVKAYGAVCDGTTDDTTAVTAAVTAMLANANASATSGPGPIYFPRSSGACKFNGSAFNFAQPTYRGWLYVIMDNDFILTGSIRPIVSTLAFVGHGSSFQGLGGTFAYAPTVSWIASGNFPVLDLTCTSPGVCANSEYFQGVSFIGWNNAGGTVGPVHIHGTTANGGGPNSLSFRGDYFAAVGTGTNALLVDADATTTSAGFGLFIRDSTFSGYHHQSQQHWTRSD